MAVKNWHVQIELDKADDRYDDILIILNPPLLVMGVSLLSDLKHTALY